MVDQLLCFFAGVFVGIFIIAIFGNQPVGQDDEQ